MILAEHKNLTLLDNKRFVLYDGTTTDSDIKHLNGECFVIHNEVSKVKHWYCSLRIRILTFCSKVETTEVSLYLLVINKKGIIKKTIKIGGIDSHSHFEIELLKMKKKHKLVLYVSGDSVSVDLKLHAL